MKVYNLQGYYKPSDKPRETKKTLCFKTWRRNKEEVIAEYDPYDYYNLKRHYTDLEIVFKEKE